jgi:hypothetical protein
VPTSASPAELAGNSRSPEASRVRKVGSSGAVAFVEDTAEPVAALDERVGGRAPWLDPIRASGLRRRSPVAHEARAAVRAADAMSGSGPPSGPVWEASPTGRAERGRPRRPARFGRLPVLPLHACRPASPPRPNRRGADGIRARSSSRTPRRRTASSSGDSQKSTPSHRSSPEVSPYARPVRGPDDMKQVRENQERRNDDAEKSGLRGAVGE